MSSFVLNRNYQLQLPNSFVEIDREEMEYVDGGGYLSNKAEGIIIGIVFSMLGKCVGKSIIADVLAAGYAYVGGQITAAVGFLIANPAVALGILGSAALTVHAIGHAKGKW